MEAEACKAAVRAFYADIWNARDFDRARGLLAPDLRFRGSLGSERVGVDAFLDYVREVTAGLSGYECTILELVAEPGQAAARVWFEGVHDGVFRGYAPSGKPLGWVGAAFFTFSANQIAEIWVLGDLAGLETALKRNAGMEERP